MPRECLKIIESKSKVRNSRSKPVVAKVSTSTSTSEISPDVSELKDMVKALLLDKKNQSQALAHQTSASVKAIEESCVTCDGAHSYQSGLTSMAKLTYQNDTASTSGSGTLPGNLLTNPKEICQGITTEVVLLIKDHDPSTSSSSPKVMNRDTEVTKDTMLPTNNGSTEDVQPLVYSSPISKSNFRASC
ncbi:hypothetical protein Tco_0344842 [Tanacetum coccineum]